MTSDRFFTGFAITIGGIAIAYFAAGAIRLIASLAMVFQ